MARLCLLFAFLFVFAESLAQEKPSTDAPLRIISDKSSVVVRRGRTNEIRWEGGKFKHSVSIFLISPRGDTTKLNESLNTGSFVWETPRELRASRRYYLRLTAGPISSTKSLRIRRKTPLSLIVMPVLIGGALYSTGILTPENNDLPTPPNPNEP